MFSIRPYQPDDINDLYRICLKTGDTGADATGLYADPELLGHVYVGPYVTLEPELCFVLTKVNRHKPRPGTKAGSNDKVDDNYPEVCGYVLATRNSAEFRDRCESDWYPSLRRQYRFPDDGDTSVDAKIIRSIHRGHQSFPSELYPAHLHVDLLPVAQGQGYGRQLMHTVFNALQKFGVAGVQLNVGPRNQNAIGFYEHLGFKRMQNNNSFITLTMTLNKSYFVDD